MFVSQSCFYRQTFAPTRRGYGLASRGIVAQILFFSKHVIQNWTKHWEEYDSDDPEDLFLRVFRALNDIDDYDNINDEDYKGNKLSHNVLVRLEYFEELVKIWSNDDLCSSVLLFVLRCIVSRQR